MSDLFEQPESVEEFEPEPSDEEDAADAVGTSLARRSVGPLPPAVELERARDAATVWLDQFLPAIAKRLNPKDFVRHGEGQPVVLTMDGPSKIAPFLGVRSQIVSAMRIPHECRPNEDFAWAIELRVWAERMGQGIETADIYRGVADSSQAYTTGKATSLAKLDDNVRQAAWTRAFNRGFHKCTGLKTFSDDELRKFGIDPGAVSGIEYRSPETTAVAKDLEAQIRQGLIDLGADPSDPSWGQWIYGASCFMQTKDQQGNELAEPQIIAKDSLRGLMGTKSGKWPAKVLDRIKTANKRVAEGKLTKGQAALDWMRGEGLGTK